LSEKSFNVDENWYTTACLELDDNHLTKYEIFKNSRWRMAAILKTIFGHNSAASCPTSVKFCVGKHSNTLIEVA